MNEPPTFVSFFSGIGGIDLGLERAGWRCIAQCESDPWRRGTPNELPDGPRYAALGDAVTVNVAQWIGLRLLEAE